MSGSVAAAVRERVERVPVGSFVRSAEIAAEAGSPAAVDVALHRLLAERVLLRVQPGLYYKGKATRFGTTRPDPLTAAYEVARDRGYSSGVGPAGVTAARSLGLTTQVPGAVEVAVPGRAPAPVAGARFTSRSPVGRHDLRPLEVAVLELLRAWPRYSEKSWSEFVDVIRDLHDRGRVDMHAVRASAMRERHREARQRAKVLETAVVR